MLGGCLPYPPGGGTGVVARVLAQKLGENLGQQVIVDNRGGASGNIGMDLVAKSPPDGYTLGLALTAQFAVNPSLYAIEPIGTTPAEFGDYIKRQLVKWSKVVKEARVKVD